VKPTRLNLCAIAHSSRGVPTIDRPTSRLSANSNGGYQVKLAPLRTYEAKCAAVGQLVHKSEYKAREIKSRKKRNQCAAESAGKK